MNTKIQNALSGTIQKVKDIPEKKLFRGKVRDSVILDKDKRAIVVTDRISAFDFILGTVPFKGQVLNQITTWWFKKLNEINIPNHFIQAPDPNISIVKNAKILPVEIIVRGYLTGSTKTSSWYAYQNLNKNICGIQMPDGMKKNQAFEKPIITPTTKPEAGSGLHDEPISKEEIIKQGLVSPQIYEKVEEYAMKMFLYGQKIAKEKNLILVDTKYEMGLDNDGNLIVIDEIHTPDSSRYWIADTYQKRFATGQDPESLDKEFVRKMIVERGYDVNSDVDPKQFMDDKLRVAASEKYIELFEKITNEKFQFPDELNAKERISQYLKKYLK